MGDFCQQPAGNAFPMMDKVNIDVPHVKQLHNWDCGIACTQMVLRFLGENLNNFEDNCEKLQFGQSTWTIDLANLIWLYKVQHHLCTQTLGVQHSYSKKNFYKNTFNVDEDRIRNLFQEASTIGLTIEKRSVGLPEINSHLTKGNVLIVLVDYNLITCQWCSPSLASCFSCMAKCFTDYQGHFIVVCGFNATSKQLYYKNPCSNSELCCCSMRNFDEARKQDGTDEDVLFIYKDEICDSAASP